MRYISLVLSTLLSLVVLIPASAGRASAPNAASCVRHTNIGFFTTPEVLGELAQVYANCFPQPACTSPTDLETIQCDGYNSYSNWLWSGPSTSLFSIAAQDTIINKAIVCAAAPPGKVIVSITFFRDIIVSVGSSVYYVVGCRVTFARCSQSQKGMTWMHSASNAQTGTITVGCNGCDPYIGDMPCTQQRPLLCIYKPTPTFPLPVGVNNTDIYYQWAGGVVATTQPVAGNVFAHISAGPPGTNANDYCVAQFGPGWRVAEFHDGWGFNFQAYGGTVDAPTVPSTRFWVHINDQQAANCWATP